MDAVGKASHEGDPRLVEPAADDRPSRRIGALARQLPVAVTRWTATEASRIRVTFDAKSVVQATEHLADRVEQLPRLWRHVGAARIEHWPILLVDDLDPQAIGRDVHEDLVLELVERRIGGDLLVQVLLDLLELGLFGAFGPLVDLFLVADFLLRRVRVGLGLLPGLLEDVVATALDDAGGVARTRPAGNRHAQRVLKIR